MATILEFRGSLKVDRRHADLPRQDVPGEIVLFPGIRYERWAEPVSDGQAVRKSRERDTLSLGD